MNTFVNQFSTRSAVSQLKRAKKLISADEDEYSDAIWGSQAGFGNMVKGVPNFTVPSVPDVCICFKSFKKEVLDAHFYWSLQLFFDYTLTTTLIPTVESKFSMARRH